MSDVTITGPAGPIEAMLTSAQGVAVGIAVLCHPHPQFGGSMHDGVLSIAARVLNEANFDVLRFNFRGVGASAGEFDNGAGETDDALAVIHYARSLHKHIHLVGYSFGSMVAARASTEVAGDLVRLWLIAPPIGRMTFPEPPAGLTTDIVIGTQDAFVDPTALAKWQDGAAINLHELDGADHFFSSHAGELTGALAASVAT